MSTYFAVSCDDCKLSSGRAFNHAEGRAKAVLKVLDCIINVEQSDPWYMFQVDFADDEGRNLYNFARDHRSHKLRIVDEYSRYSEDIDLGEHSHVNLG
jgi:hypothetical protein